MQQQVFRRLDDPRHEGEECAEEQDPLILAAVCTSDTRPTKVGCRSRSGLETEAHRRPRNTVGGFERSAGQSALVVPPTGPDALVVCSLTSPNVFPHNGLGAIRGGVRHRPWRTRPKLAGPETDSQPAWTVGPVQRRQLSYAECRRCQRGRPKA